MYEEIKALASQLQQLYKQAYHLYKPEVDWVIKTHIKDEKTIQHLLDGLLDNCADSDVLLLYKKLCRYYWDINPQATANYINFYREMWEETDDVSID